MSQPFRRGVARWNAGAIACVALVLSGISQPARAQDDEQFAMRAVVLADSCEAEPQPAQTPPEGRQAKLAAIGDTTTADFRAVSDTSFGQVVTKPAGPPPTPRHTGIKAMAKDLVEDVKHLPSKENLFWVGLGGGLSIVAHPFDDNVNTAVAYNASAQTFFKLGKYLGQLYTLLPVAATVYVAGRAKDEPKVSHVGTDLLQSLAISEALTLLLKYPTHRERPDGSGPTSFPSGHAADTFAFATALERHLGWKGAVPAYIFASYVAISRLPDNRHYLSDTVFGATVGIIAGRTVTRHGRPFPLTIAVVPAGAAIIYVRRAD